MIDLALNDGVTTRMVSDTRDRYDPDFDPFSRDLQQVAFNTMHE